MKPYALMQAGSGESLGKKCVSILVKLNSRATCLDHNNPDSRENQKITSFQCHGQGGNQYFSYTKLNEIRQSGNHEMCLTVSKGNFRVRCVQFHRPTYVAVSCLPHTVYRIRSMLIVKI